MKLKKKEKDYFRLFLLVLLDLMDWKDLLGFFILFWMLLVFLVVNDLLSVGIFMGCVFKGGVGSRL